MLPEEAVPLLSALHCSPPPAAQVPVFSLDVPDQGTDFVPLAPIKVTFNPHLFPDPVPITITKTPVSAVSMWW